VGAIFALASSVAVCASEPLEFADWTNPLAEGTPIYERAAVPIQDRTARTASTERIEMVEDLVIGR